MTDKPVHPRPRTLLTLMEIFENGRFGSLKIKEIESLGKPTQLRLNLTTIIL